jgi:hypothetical protein
MRLTRKAQMSLVMLLVVAIALVFYAVSFNWSRISAYKTQVTIAATTGAAQLGSMAAAYGEFFLRGQMDGQLHQKDTTSSMWKLILAVLITIAAVVVGVVSLGSLSELSVAMIGFAIGLVVSSVISIIAVINDGGDQRGLTRNWTKAMKQIPTQEGRFVEGAIQGMFSAVVNDVVTVPDRGDMDMDGRWYSSVAALGSDPTAKISRFAYYYTDRVNTDQPPPPIEALKKVLKNMQEHLGLPPLVPWIMASGSYTPQTDFCCIPPGMERLGASFVFGCSADVFLPQCQVNNLECTRSSLFACYVFDVRFQVTGAVNQSPTRNLMFLYGEDDRNAHFKMVSGVTTPEATPFLPQLINSSSGQESADGGVYRGSDATGTFFPFLWTLADTNPYVKDLWIPATPVGTTSGACHWRSGTACQLEVSAPDSTRLGKVLFRPSSPAVAYSQLSLPGCSYGDCYINMFRNTLLPTANLNALTSYDTRRIDGVRGIAAFTPVDDPACSSDATGSYWKKGSDRHSQTFQYPVAGSTVPAIQPIKYMSASSPFTAIILADVDDPDNVGFDPDLDACSNTSVVKKRWRDDVVDYYSLALSDFSGSVINVLAEPESRYQEMAASIGSWGPSLVRQTKQLDGLAAHLDSWTEEVNRWLAGNNASYDYTDDTLWCLPAAENNPSLTSAERTAILNGTSWGTLTSVIQCLQYNSNNYNRFNDCYNNCSTAPSSTACANLPRSLVAGFDPNNPAALPQAGGFTIRTPITWDDAFLTRIGVTRAEAAVIPLSELQDAWDVLLDTELYSYYSAAIATRRASFTPAVLTLLDRANTAGYATLTAAEQTTLNTAILNVLYPMPVDTVYDRCTTLAKSGIQDSPYMLNISQSRTLAQFQSIKFNKRYLYLADLRQRARDIVDTFADAEDYLSSALIRSGPDPETAPGGEIDLFTQFLDAGTTTPTGMVRAIVDYITNMRGSTGPAPSLTGRVVYGWFSPPRKGMPRGDLHIVQVEASLPGFPSDIWKSFPALGSSCTTLPTGACLYTDKLPWIDTYTTWLGAVRHYKMRNHTGFVGARVIRYDEDQSGSLSFMSGVPLWKFKYSNPSDPDHASWTDAKVIADGMYVNCGTAYYKKQTSSTGTSSYITASFPDIALRGAFMFDLPLVSAPGAFTGCVSGANELLKRGVASEACVKYWPACKNGQASCDAEDKHQYDIKFVPCR